MTSKEALETISELHFCGYDPTEKEWYESGKIKEDHQEEVEEIRKDLDDLEWLKSKLNLTFLDSLPDYRDRLKVMEIMGYKYKMEIK